MPLLLRPLAVVGGAPLGMLVLWLSFVSLLRPWYGDGVSDRHALSPFAFGFPPSILAPSKSVPKTRFQLHAGGVNGVSDFPPHVATKANI